MDYQRKQYFKELADPTVKGLTVLEADPSEGLRVAEKWLRSDGSIWTNYWLPESKLDERLSEGKVEFVGELSDEQFEKVNNAVESRDKALA